MNGVCFAMYAGEAVRERVHIPDDFPACSLFPIVIS